MMNSVPDILFYVVRNPIHVSDSYSLFNIITDRLIMDRVRASDIRDFLIRNNPIHPMIRALAPESRSTLDSYVSNHNAIYYSNNDQYVGFNDSDPDLYGYLNSAIEDADSPYSDNEYTELNNIPYINGHNKDWY